MAGVIHVTPGDKEGTAMRSCLRAHWWKATPVVLLLLIFFAPLIAEQTTPPPRVVLPMERTQYFIGESVPIAIRDFSQGHTLEVVDTAGRVVAMSGTTTVAAWRLNTAKLAADRYEIQLDGQPTGVEIGLVSPLRASCAALTDEGLPAPATREETEHFRQALQETGINAFFATAYHETGSGRYTQHDLLAPARAMLFVNPYTRATSGHPARVYAPEVNGMRQRMALCAQANGRYPTFGGFEYGSDVSGFFNRADLLQFWGWGGQEEALREYLHRSSQALYDDFTARTGLRPVTPEEFRRYCLAIGHPEFAPDEQPKLHWAVANDKHDPPLSSDARRKLECRIDAWSQYLMGLNEECYTRDGAYLRAVMPSLRNTSSVNLDHSTVREGQYPPSAYAPLDFRYLSAWNNTVASPDYNFQWLFSAGMLDIARRPDQPSWIGSSLGPAQHLADYPGKFQRMAGENLAYGGTGLGLTIKGHSTVASGATEDTLWENIRGQAGGEDLIGGREFLQRFAPLRMACTATHPVAVLFSRSQLGRQHLSLTLDTPLFNTFIALARLGYTPRFITEEEIAAGGLSSVQALIVVNQSVALPDAVMAQLCAFTKAGGRLLTDHCSTAALPSAIRLEIGMPYAHPARSMDWNTSDMPVLTHTLLEEHRYAELAPALLCGLGDAARTPLISERGAAAMISTSQFSGGPDACYVVAVDDAIESNQADWLRTTERLVPNGVFAGVLYDLTAERALGPLAPVTCACTDLTARVYGLLARPVTGIDLRAGQTVVEGDDLRLAVRFIGSDGKPLRAVLPFHLTLTRPDGACAQEFYRTTDDHGNFTMSWPVAANAMPGVWSISVRSQLDGMSASLPVTVRLGKNPSPLTPIHGVVARNTAQIAAQLVPGATFVLPIFDSFHRQELLAIAKELKASLATQGIRVEIRDHPRFSTYVAGYAPTDDEQRENAAAMAGETIGRMKVTTVDAHDWFATQSGFVFGKPIILLDLVSERDNEMAERLTGNGLLWPKVSREFPGPGGATVQLVKSAFAFGVDALVIQAEDVAGLRAGIHACRALPADWLTPGVEGARATLLNQLGIGAAPRAPVSPYGLTANGLFAGQHPQPLALRFPGARPLSTEDIRRVQPTPPSIYSLPASLTAQQLTTYIRQESRYFPGITPDSAWHGERTAGSATLVKVDAPRAGVYTITLHGAFRATNSDIPYAQTERNDLLALSLNPMPSLHGPMGFDVRIDGQPAGRLTHLTGGLPNTPGLNQPISLEEGATQVNGAIQLTAGIHEILLIHHNIAGGEIDAVEISRKG